MSPYIARLGAARVLVTAAAGLWLLVWSAAPAAAAGSKEKDASRLFFSGKYQDALAIYVDLAVETSNPIYMCEIGRCHQRLGNLVEARRNVRECLAAARLTPAKKRQYQAVLAEIEAAASQAPAAAPAAVPPPAATEPPAAASAAPPPASPLAAGAPAVGPASATASASATPAAPAAAPLPPAPAAGPPATPAPAWDPGPYGQYGPPPASLRRGDVAPEAPGGGGWMRPTAFVAGAVGLLGVGAGVYAGLQAKQKFDDVVRVYDDAAYQDGKRWNRRQFIGYGVGAVGLGAAAILFLRSPAADGVAAGPRGLALVVAPQGLGLAGSF
jgi:hypothetical protein